MNQRIKELFSNTLIFTIANFSSKILVFLMVPLYTAVLSTEEYGISDMAMTICGLMLPILTLSISNAVLRFCFLKEYKNEDVFAIGHSVIIKGAICSIIITAGMFFFQIFPQLGLYIWFVPALFFFNSYLTFLSYYSQAVGRVKLSAISGVVSAFTTVILNLVFLLLFHWGIIGYMLSYLVGAIVSVAVMLLSLPLNKDYFISHNRELRKQMVKFSVPLVPNDLSWWALDSFNRFFIISTLSVSAVGIYSASAKIPAILTTLCGIFAQAWTLSALSEYGTEENANFIRKVHKKMYSFLGLVTATFIALSKPLSLLLLRGEFSSCWYLIPFLMISVFMGAMVGFYGSIYSAERKNEMQFMSTLVGAIVSVIIIILFLSRFGIIVSAISNMIGFIIIWFIRKEGIKKFLDIGMTTSQCCRDLLLLIAMAVTVSLSIWWASAILFIMLFLLNMKDVFNIFSFFYSESISYIKNNRK